MIEKPMTLKVDFRLFIDEEGNVSALTVQAKTVFNFLNKIVSSVSKTIGQPLINVDLKCNTRADELSCDGNIDATCTETGLIVWHCDTCEGSGSISNWQGSIWDKQNRIIH